MKKIVSYLDFLQFDESLKKKWFVGYFLNPRLVALLVISIFIFGLFSFFTLPRRLNPEIEIPIVSVRTVFPGASPNEIEQLVTIPLEKKLNNAKNLNSLQSTSAENVSLIVTEFTSDTSVDDALREVSKLVSEVSNLPENAIDPVVQELDFENIPVWTFVLTTSHSRASLERIARVIEDDLESASQINNVVVSGLEKKEIQIILDREKLAQYSLSPLQVSNVITNTVRSFPAGKISSTGSSFAFAIDQTTNSIEDIRNLPLNIDDQQILLADLALVQYKSASNQNRSYISDKDYPDLINQQAITISVYKNRNADISRAQQQAQEIVNSRLAEYDNTFKIVSLENIASEIDEQFSDLYQNFFSTILLVFMTLFIFLGIRQALIASISIPMTFFISFIVMNMTGQSLNFLTLFSLLLALGLLVDDAIVIISAMTSYFSTKKFDSKQTGLLVLRDFFVPIWTTTITTVWAFLPLLLASGIIGEFIKPIPIVVSATLLASTSVAVLITLPVMIILLNVRFRVFSRLMKISEKGNVKGDDDQYKIQRRNRIKSLIGLLGGGFINPASMVKKYENLIRSIIISSYKKKLVLVAVVILSIFSYLLVPLGFVQNEFFPRSDADILYATVELPIGTTNSVTEEITLEIAKKLFEIEEVEILTSVIGQENRSGGSMLGSSSADHLASITLRLIKKEDRSRNSDQISNEITKIINSFGVSSKVFAQSGGPPAGSDLTLKIFGDDLAELQKIGDEIAQKTKIIEGAKNVQKSITPGSSKLVFIPDLSKLNQYRLSVGDLALWTRTAVSGFEITKVDFDGFDQETPVVYYLSENQLSPEEIGDISVLSPLGRVSLAELGKIELSANPSIITREDGKRTLTVTADASIGFNVVKMNEELLDYAGKMTLPKGYGFATGGVNEENQKSVQSILQAMILSVLLILATMVIQLGSFRKAFLVILVIPLAVTGVFILLALSGTPLSFPGLIGILALFGIVVNNSIMVVEKINQNLHIGMNQEDAIVDASASRLEPIFFSSLTTIIGLIPITLSDPIWRGLGGAIISGLFFSGAVMLLLIPILYTYFFRSEKMR